MRHCLAVLSVWILLTGTGCAPALIGAGAAGAYRVATDERGVGQMWADATITTKVKTALIQDPHVDAMKIDVDTLERNVTLTGLVGSDREAEQAVRIAGTIAGVKSVKNNMRVGSKSVGDAVDDMVLGTKIRTKLAGEPGIRSLNIDVDIDKGVVSLTGIVENARQRDRILEIVRSVPGCVDVVNNLTLKKS